MHAEIITDKDMAQIMSNGQIYPKDIEVFLKCSHGDSSDVFNERTLKHSDLSDFLTQVIKLTSVTHLERKFQKQSQHTWTLIKETKVTKKQDQDPVRTTSDFSPEIIFTQEGYGVTSVSKDFFVKFLKEE